MINAAISKDDYRLAGLICLGIAPLLLNGFYNPWLSSRPALICLVELITWLALPALIIVRAGSLFQGKDIGLASDSVDGGLGLLKWFALYLVVPIACMIVYMLANWFAATVLPDELWTPGFTYQQFMPNEPHLRVVVLLWMSCTAALVEEFYFRALLRRLFRNKRFLFIVISSLLFAAIHWENGSRATFSAFLLGISMALIYLHTDKLLPLVFAHLAIDLVYL
jgi:membrane protease YdiL (CAAX protease family)